MVSIFVDKRINRLRMLTELFQHLGFSDKEAAIYTLLYQRGPNSVSVLSQLSKIKRTSVYDILKSLMARDLVMSFQQGSTTYFAIDDVQKLAFEQKERLNFATQLIAQLKQNTFHQEGMQINYYKGQEGYRQMYEDMLSCNPPDFQAWLNIENFNAGIDQKREDEWTLERVKKGITARLLIQDSKLSRAMQKDDKKLKRETRLIPAKAFPYDSSCVLYQDHITFFHTSEKIFSGIRIHHADMYALQKQIFEMTWSMF